VEITVPVPVYNWGGSQLFAGLPNPVNFVETSWGDDGDQLNPTAGGQAVGGYVSSPTSGQAAVIVGNSGRTILNGFLLDNAQFASDAIQLAKNEIRALLGSGVPVVISPTVTGNFTNGVWSGLVTVLQPATNLVLTAADAFGHRGDSLSFDIALINDLGVAILDEPDPVAVGALLTNVITAFNTGPTTATSVSLTNFLPPSVTFVSVQSSQGGCV